MNTPAAASSNFACSRKIKSYPLFYLMFFYYSERGSCYLSRIDSFEDRLWILLVAMDDEVFEILEDLSVLQFGKEKGVLVCACLL